MKKLVLAVAAVVLAIGAQAATVNWKTGANIVGPDGSTKLGKNAYTMYVWDNLTAAEYFALTVDMVYDTYGSQLGTALSASSGSTTLGTTVKNSTATDATTYYAAVLLVYNDGTQDYYMANLATATTDATGSGATVTNLGKFVGGGTSGTATSWTAVPSESVPEPTSGLLLLLGMAGLALRRKQA